MPAVGPAFVLTKHGSMTGHPDEVIQGDRSLKGSYSGLSSYHAYLRTDQSVLPLTPEETYRVTFDYRIPTTPDRGFETLFYSPIGGGEENWLPSIMIKGRAGDTGSKTLTNTLGNYDDYDLRWNVVGTGAIAIDNIRIMNLSTGQDVATEDGEKIEPLFGDSRSDYLYPPALDMPDFSKIALQWQGNGYTAVIGEAGAIPGAFPVLIMSPNTTSGSLTNARPNGSFSSEIVAPPGSWVIVKYDPTPQRQWLGASLLDPRDGDLFDIFTGSAQDAPGAWGYVQFEADSREGTPFSPYSPFGSNK